MRKLMLAGLLVILSASFCKSEPIILKTSTVDEDRPVSAFNGVASSGYVDVIIKLGNKESLRLEGDSEGIADLITEVKGSTLNIRPKTKVYRQYSFKKKKVTAFITVRKLTHLVLSGSSEMRVDSKISANNFTATLSGSGKIILNTDADTFVGVISGSGILMTTGTSEKANITVSGSGKFAGRNFAVQALSAQVSGSGNIESSVSDRLSAVVSGSGSIYYAGNPQIDKTTIGSGRVRKI